MLFCCISSIFRFIISIPDEDDDETLDDVGVCVSWFVVRKFTANGFPPSSPLLQTLGDDDEDGVSSIRGVAEAAQSF